MAGYVFEKVRGQNRSNRTKVELVLNKDGLRIDSRKSKGFFCKMARV